MAEIAPGALGAPSEYRICANTEAGRSLTILASSRASALRHVRLFRAHPERYPQVSVEVGGRIFVDEQIESMP